MASAFKSSIETLFDYPEQRFINRELSWIEFNRRVLEEASNSHHPLLERVKFLSISASNLNEFYMVRVAGLEDQVQRKLNKKSKDGLTPLEQLKQIRKKTHQLVHDQQACWHTLHKELKNQGIEIVDRNELTKKERSALKEYFLNNIFPALSPIAVDQAHPLPFLPNLGLALVMQLKKEGKKHPQLAITLLPLKLERFIRIKEGKDRFILAEDVVEIFCDTIFPNTKIQGFGVIHVIRDSDLEISDEAEDLVANFESAVKMRKRGSVIHLNISDSLPHSIRQRLLDELELEPYELFELPHIVGLNALMELYQCQRPDLKFKHYNERFPERIHDFHGNCFDAIAHKDIVIHHPYETFDVVVKFLQQAARDPNVIAIKQTLYRTSSDSPIVKALIEAAEAGKSVTAVVELKARFDEEANIRWARNLERAGAQVVFGFVELKTHAKISLVVRREGKENNSYVHFGTGNYHPETARVYSDLSFFTCNKALCHDASLVFNYLTGYSVPDTFSKVAISPLATRNTLIDLIEEEIAHAKAGKPAAIWAKMNALVDSSIIDALYRASQAGVAIELVVRGICSLRPGIDGFSENIQVRSMVGRFLEHARISCFGAGYGLPSPEAKLFISSADWMPRNFDSRVEVMVPVENPTVHEQILGQIMLANIKDMKQSWILQPDGSYQRMKFKENDFSAHEYFLTNPSLSGRGKALHRADSKQQRQKIYQLFGKE